MKTKFTPSKEELKKLAKTAGSYIIITGIKFLETKEKLIPYRKWKPHLDRDQIAMVIEGLTKKEVRKYYTIMQEMWVINEYKCDGYGVWMQTVHPSISCEKLLEILS